MLNLVTLTAAPGSEASVRERRAEKEAPALQSCDQGFGKGEMAALIFWVCAMEMQHVGMGTLGWRRGGCRAPLHMQVVLSGGSNKKGAVRASPPRELHAWDA